MKQKKTFWAMSAVSAVLALSIGCDQEKSAEQPITAQPKAAASVESDIVALPPPPKDSDVVVSVGEAKLTWKELNDVVEEQIAYTKMTGQAIPSEQLKEAKQEFRRRQVQTFIVDQVIAAAAKKLGVTLDDDFRKQQIAELEKAQGKSLNELLKTFPLGEEKAREMLDKQWLELKLLNEKVFATVAVTDEEVAEEVKKTQAEIKLVDEEMANYVKQLADKTATFEDLVQANSAVKQEIPVPKDRLSMMIPGEKAQQAILNAKVGDITEVLDVPGAKVIFKIVKNEAAKPADEVGAQKQIETIRERLVKGEDFAKVAEEVSDCPSGKRDGGNLGSFGKGAMVPEFEKAACAQPINEIGPVVKTPFGFHIIKVTARDEAKGTVTASHILISTKSEPGTVTLLALLKPVPQDIPAEQIKSNLLESRKREAAVKFFEKQKADLGVSCTLYPELAAPLPVAK